MSKIGDAVRQERREQIEKKIKDQSVTDWREIYARQQLPEDRRNETTGY